MVRTPADAIILFEACRLGLLPRVQRRLSEKERQSIRSGSVFVWDEREAGMRRWTDGKSWSASRVSGSFLTYREMEGKRGGSGFSSAISRSGKTPESGRNSADDVGEAEEGPDGYRYKPDGLMKQSFSITTSTGQHLHLISYYSRSHPMTPGLQQPSTDPNLRNIRPQKGMYPESTVNDQSNVPAVTRSPMMGASPYAMSPPGYPRTGATHPHSYLPPGYHPYAYPPSPMGTPPHTYPMHYAPPNALPPIAGGGSHQPPYGAQIQTHQHYMPQQHTVSPRGQDHSGLPSLNHGSSTSSAGTVPYPPAPSPLSNNASTAPSQETKSPQQPVSTNFQIDPRLMGAPQTSETTTDISNVDPSSSTDPPAESRSQQISSESSYPPVSASEVPSINNLVNGAKAAAAIVKAEHEEKQAKTESSQSDDRRSASRSPGGTKKEGPKDIPSEKLGFSADMRALRQLDKVFTA